MADKKISALTASSTPLAGTEVLPIVQSGSTVKVSVANLTAGRSVSMLDMTSTDGTRQTYTQVSASNNVIRQTNGLSYEWAYGLSAPGVAGLSDSYSITRFNGTSWSLLAQMDSSGNQTLSTGNLVIGTSGKGIDFSATSHPAGMTSELLNDYEEGTFTPAIVGTGGAGVGTYATQVGRYTKIGRQVTVQIELSWSAHTGSGDMFIDGLPFTCSTVRSSVSAISYDMTLAALTYLGGRVTASGNSIELLKLAVGGGVWSGVAMDTNVVSLIVTATYTV